MSDLIEQVQTMDGQLQSIQRLVERHNEQIKQLVARLAKQEKAIHELRLREKDVNRFLGDIGSPTVGDAIGDTIDRLDFKV